MGTRTTKSKNIDNKRLAFSFERKLNRVAGQTLLKNSRSGGCRKRPGASSAHVQPARRSRTLPTPWPRARSRSHRACSHALINDDYPSLHRTTAVHRLADRKKTGRLVVPARLRSRSSGKLFLCGLRLFGCGFLSSLVSSSLGFVLGHKLAVLSLAVVGA